MTKKIAISLPDRTLAHAKALVTAGRAESVSGYIAGLIERAAEEESISEMLARWDREDGWSPAEIVRQNAKVTADFAKAGLVPAPKRAGKRRRGS